jgi:hypothetical protein
MKFDIVTYRLAGKTAGGFAPLFMKCTHPHFLEGMMGIFCFGHVKFYAVQDGDISVLFIIVICRMSFSQIK